MKREFLVSGKQFYIHESMPLVSGDANCYELVFYAPCSLDGSTFTVTAVRADGKSFTAMGEASGKTARYVLDNSMYAVSGPLKLRTVITDADKSVITANEISFEVIEGTESDGAIEADTNYPVLTRLILKVQDAMSAIPEIDKVTEKAELVIQDAETKALFANSCGESAKNAAERAESVAERAETLVGKIEGAKDSLPPAFTEQDEGKLLYLARSGAVYNLESVSASYEIEDDVILDAGLLDEENAFIDISAAEIYDLGISSPLDERCAFGFQLMPDSLDYTTDFDICAEAVEETDNGFRMIFPAEHCQPFAENNIQSVNDLFTFFEVIQMNAEYPEALVTPTWGTEEEVLTPAFLDKCVISPAVSLANRYTDEKTNFAVTIRDTKFGPGRPFVLDGITKGVKNLEIQLGSDISDNPSVFSLRVFDEDGIYERDIFTYELPKNLKTGDRVVFDTEICMCIVYPFENPELPYSLDDSFEFVQALKYETFDKIELSDRECMTHYGEVEYYVSAEYMIDDKIKSAVIDSWEVAV